MASNMFGTFDQGNQVVTLNSKQTIQGEKNFTSDFNNIAGTLIQPKIEALGTVLTPTILSYLSGTTSNIQTQLNNSGAIVTQLNQALQALEPAPNSTTVQFNKNVLVKDNATPTLSSTLSDQQLIVNNGAGGNLLPVVSWNQVGTSGGVLVKETYNQRNAVTGEFSRHSYYAKNSQGKIEYARIHQNASSISTTPKGKLDFDVCTGSTNPTNFLSLNGSSNRVEINRPLNMSGYFIESVPQIFSSQMNLYGLQSVLYYSSSTGTFPQTNLENNLRITLINEGVPDYLEPLSGNFPSAWGSILCSCNYNGYTYVGLDNGYVYYSSDGTNWNSVNDIFNGAVLCMTEFQSVLYVGGQFSSTVNSMTTLNHLAYIDSGNNINNISFSNYGVIGFNDTVKTLCASLSGNLYIGGRMSTLYGGSLVVNFFAIMDGGQSIYNIDSSFGSGSYGFQDGVNFIKEDTNHPNNFIVGGDFTNIQVASGFYATHRNCILQFNGSYDLIASPYEVVYMDQPPKSIAQNGGSFYIVGDFTGLPYGNYFTTFDFNGSTYYVSSNPYGFSGSSPIEFVVQAGYIAWGDNSGNLYEGGNIVATSPVGGNFIWSTMPVWGTPIYSTNSPSQAPFTAYFLVNSNFINVGLGAPVTICYGTSNYTGGVYLNNTGAFAEFLYREATSKLYVVGSSNASFY